MTISGSCLCGGVRFEIDRATGPMEICHCNRCRKRSGAAALPMVRVRTTDFRWLSGVDLLRSHAAPVLYRPPAYTSSFCSRCGSPLPAAEPRGDELEIPAGLFDDDPGTRPDKHIFVELVPAWDRITDALPQLTIRELIRERTGADPPADFRMRTHARPHDPREVE